jgi:hypothetical protein
MTEFIEITDWFSCAFAPFRIRRDLNSDAVRNLSDENYVERGSPQGAPAVALPMTIHPRGCSRCAPKWRGTRQ